MSAATDTMLDCEAAEQRLENAERWRNALRAADIHAPDNMGLCGPWWELIKTKAQTAVDDAREACGLRPEGFYL